MHMKNGRNLRRLILFSLVAGCTLGGLGSGVVYANGYPPYEQILYINEDNTVTQNDKNPSLTLLGIVFNGFCFINLIPHFFDYLMCPYYPAYTMGCYQIVIGGDNGG